MNFTFSLDLKKFINYRPHPKDGEGNVFTLSTPGHLGGGGVSPAQPGGGGVRSVQPGVGGVSPAVGGGQSSQQGGGGQSSQWGGGGQSAGGGGVSILRPLAGGMPLAFTQEDFLVHKMI